MFDQIYNITVNQWIGIIIITCAVLALINMWIDSPLITPCPSTISTYDHKAARATMAKQDIEEHLAIAAIQREQAVNYERIECAGVCCNRDLYLIDMFRCYFCGAYFCPKCARAHFGDRALE